MIIAKNPNLRGTYFNRQIVFESLTNNKIILYWNIHYIICIMNWRLSLWTRFPKNIQCRSMRLENIQPSHLWHLCNNQNNIIHVIYVYKNIVKPGQMLYWSTTTILFPQYLLHKHPNPLSDQSTLVSYTLHLPDSEFNYYQPFFFPLYIEDKCIINKQI